LFSIHSVNSERELTFSSFQGEQFQVEFKGSGIYALTGVWVDNHVQSLSVFFEELTRFTTPWQGVREWESLEGEFSISATCTTLGQVDFSIEIRHYGGGTEAWFVQGSLVTELGQLEKIARDAKAFFQKESA
jgi:hypothetical protein